MVSFSIYKSNKIQWILSSRWRCEMLDSQSQSKEFLHCLHFNYFLLFSCYFICGNFIFFYFISDTQPYMSKKVVLLALSISIVIKILITMEKLEAKNNKFFEVYFEIFWKCLIKIVFLLWVPKFTSVTLRPKSLRVL